MPSSIPSHYRNQTRYPRSVGMRRTLMQRLITGVGPVLALFIGAGVMASAQSSSPFANQKKKQAWEQPQADEAQEQTPSSQPQYGPQTGSPTSNAAPSRFNLRSDPSQPNSNNQAPARAPQSQPSYGAQAPRAAAPTGRAGATYLSPPQSSQAGSSSSPFAPPSGQNRTYQNRPYGAGGSAQGAPYTAPQNRTYQGQNYQSPSYSNPQQQQGYANGPMQRRSLSGTNPAELAGGNPQAQPPYSNPSYNQGQGGTNTQSNSPFASQNPPAWQSGQEGYNQDQYGQPNYEGDGYAQTGPGAYPTPPQKRSWADRMGFGAISTLIRGALRGGGGARDVAGGWEEVFVGEADLEVEVSAITQGGLEYGVNLQGRAEYEEGRKGFTRRLPDCPPTLAGCASVQFNGNPTAIRGHHSQFYTAGPDIAEDTQAALESAHLFLRSAYGDVTVGFDDGAAYLFSLGAPTLLNTGASNASVDYTGLDAVKTVNEASGFAEKVTYTSPRLLGDQIGVGVQVGVSYAPDPYVCGVDYCVDRSDIQNVLTPDLEDIVEVGVALDRTFDNGLSIEGTATYAMGSEVSGINGLKDLESIGAGLEVKLSDWTLGGSYLRSNQAVVGGAYTAYDVGLTWQPSALGFTIGYGHATDDLVGLTSDQYVAGISWDFNDRLRISTGVQYADRETLRDTGAATAQAGSEDSLGIFIEGGITF